MNDNNSIPNNDESLFSNKILDDNPKNIFCFFSFNETAQIHETIDEMRKNEETQKKYEAQKHEELEEIKKNKEDEEKNLKYDLIKFQEKYQLSNLELKRLLFVKKKFPEDHCIRVTKEQIINIRKRILLEAPELESKKIVSKKNMKKRISKEEEELESKIIESGKIGRSEEKKLSNYYKYIWWAEQNISPRPTNLRKIFSQEVLSKYIETTSPKHQAKKHISGAVGRVFKAKMENHDVTEEKMHKLFRDEKNIAIMKPFAELILPIQEWKEIVHGMKNSSSEKNQGYAELLMKVIEKF